MFYVEYFDNSCVRLMLSRVYTTKHLKFDVIKTNMIYLFKVEWFASMKWCLWIVVKYQRKEALINGLNPILHELFDHRFLLGGRSKMPPYETSKPKVMGTPSLARRLAFIKNF